MSLKPIYDIIVVQPIEEETTSNGIILVDPELTQQYALGEVFAVGQGYKLPEGGVHPLTVKVGDTVVYRKGVEVKIEDEGEDVILLSESNVLSIKV